MPDSLEHLQRHSSETRIILKYKSALIITYGRSGSTLLQGILNKIEGVRLNGENQDFCYGLFQAWRSLLSAKEKANNDKCNESTHPWFGAQELDPDLFLSGLKPLIKAQLLGKGVVQNDDIVYGFKEIRYIHHLDEFDEYLSFLNKVFPDPVFIFNVRLHDDVLKSAWWKNSDPVHSKALLQRADALFAQYVDEHSNACLVRYEEIVKGGDEIDRLLKFLDADISQQIIMDTLNTVHSYDVSNKVKMKCQNHAPTGALARIKKFGFNTR
jgi:hypothetical protein